MDRFFNGRVARAATALILATAFLPAEAQDWEAVEITTQSLGGNVHALFGRGGNIGVWAGEDGVVLIDDQFAPLTERITAAVAEISDGDIRFVLNTHWHGDHTGGNENLGEAGAIIVAHDNVRARMSVEQFRATVNRTTPASPEGALPVVTFSNEMSFHLNGEEARVYHVPHGHTDGDSAVHFTGSNVFHMGDLFFNGFYPFIDVDSGGSVDGLIAGLDRLLGIVDAESVILPGHGPVADRDDLRAYRDVIATVRDRVAERVAAGDGLEEIVAAGLTADFDEVWQPEGAFITGERLVTSMYHSLTMAGEE